MILTVQNISKSINGALILDDISLELHSGHIYGFVGPNGSGKTMLFRAISGLMKTDKGSVDLDGRVLKRDFQVLPNLGIVIENVGLYNELTGYENLEYLAGFRNVISKGEILQVLERVGLDPYDKRTYRKYSLGMKQRLAIAQAIMERPDVLMLDEPTNALDSEGVDTIRSIILAEKERGAIILLASHNAEDIRVLADSYYTIANGRLVTEGPREKTIKDT